jgi:hypothetical protein
LTPNATQLPCAKKRLRFALLHLVHHNQLPSAASDVCGCI